MPARKPTGPFYPAYLEIALEHDRFSRNNPLILRAPKARLEGWANAIPFAVLRDAATRLLRTRMV
jgi:hypothetical protein